MYIVDPTFPLVALKQTKDNHIKSMFKNPPKKYAKKIILTQA